MMAITAFDDVPLSAGGGTIDNPFVFVRAPRQLARLVQFEPVTEDLEWVGPKKVSMGKRLVGDDGRLRKPQPYGVIRSKAVLEWLWGHNLYKPGVTYAMAHIVFWSMFHGRRPHLGMEIDHVEALCPHRNTLCCNPLHLEEVTTSENIRRMQSARVKPIAEHWPLFRPEFFLEGSKPREDATQPVPERVLLLGEFRSSSKRYAHTPGNRERLAA